MGPSRRDQALFLGLGLGGAAVAAALVVRFLALLARPRAAAEPGLALLYFAAAGAQALPLIGLPLFFWTRRMARLERAGVRPLRTDWTAALRGLLGALALLFAGVTLVGGVEAAMRAALLLVALLGALGLPLLVSGALFRGMARRAGAELEPLWAFVSALSILGGAAVASVIR